MAKISLTRKSITIIVIIVALLVSGGAAAGVWYAVASRELVVSKPIVDALFAEPEYTVRISWEPVKGAERYSLEYIYTAFDGEVHVIDNIADTSVMVGRKRGVLRYRLLAHGKYSAGAGDWTTTYIEPLQIAELTKFNMELVKPMAYRIDADSFVPVTYNYKGETYTINYYEVRITNPDGIVPVDGKPISYSEIIEGVTFNLGDNGIYEIALRPVLYADVFGEKSYDEWLYALYEPNTNYTRITLSV